MTSLRNLTGNFVSTETIRKICIIFSLNYFHSIRFYSPERECTLRTRTRKKHRVQCSRNRKLKGMAHSVFILTISSISSMFTHKLLYPNETLRCTVRRVPCTCPSNRCSTTGDGQVNDTVEYKIYLMNLLHRVPLTIFSS